MCFDYDYNKTGIGKYLVAELLMCKTEFSTDLHCG